MLSASILLLATLTGASATESIYHCTITERATESGKVSEDFGRFELVIENRNNVQVTAVLRRTGIPVDWQARFILQSDEAGTLWFDADDRASKSNDDGVDALFLNLEDGNLGLYFEWTLPTEPGQSALVIAQANLMGHCHLFKSGGI